MCQKTSFVLSLNSLLLLSSCHDQPSGSCGAVKATLEKTPVPGVISSLYYHINGAVEKCDHNLDKAIEENVRLQIKQLEVSPVLSGLVKEGKLMIVGGVYNMQTGQVEEIPLN